MVFCDLYIFENAWKLETSVGRVLVLCLPCQSLLFISTKFIVAEKLEKHFITSIFMFSFWK